MNTNISKQFLMSLLEVFHIHDFVTKIEVLEDFYSPQFGEIKYIAKLSFSHRTAIIIKIVHDRIISLQLIEEQGRLAENFRNHNILTPEKYKTLKGNYGFVKFVCLSDIEYPTYITCEEFIDDKKTKLTTDNAYNLGAILARMHRVSIKNNLHIASYPKEYCRDSKYPLFSVLEKILEKYKKERMTMQNIVKKNKKEAEHIERCMGTFRKCAVQGDLSYDNYSVNDRGIFVYDYESAQDRERIRDVFIQSLCLAYKTDEENIQVGVSRYELWNDFMKGYFIEARGAFNQLELDILKRVETLVKSAINI